MVKRQSAYGSRNRASAFLIAVALTVGMAIGVPSLARAAGNEIQLNDGNVGKTLSYNSQDYSTCDAPPVAGEWDAWHFIAPSNVNFTDIAINFTYSGGTLGPDTSTDFIKGQPRSTDPSHWFVYTRHGLNPTLQMSAAWVNSLPNGPDQFQLSHTCSYVVPPPVDTKTVTTATYIGDANDRWNLTDVATVKKLSDDSALGAIGNVTFSVRKCATNTTAWIDCSNETLFSDGSLTLALGAGGTVTFTGWVNKQTNPGTYYYLMHADFVPTDSNAYNGSSDNGDGERFSVTIQENVGPQLTFCDLNPNDETCKPKKDDPPAEPLKPAPPTAPPIAPSTPSAVPTWKSTDPTVVAEKDTKVVGCGVSVTFDLTGPADAQYSTTKLPARGKLTIDTVNRKATWTPDPGFCDLGGNDGFVLAWKDSKGNTGTITKVILINKPGDRPNLIRTGQDAPSNNSRNGLIMLALLAAGLFVRRARTVKA